MGNSRIEHLAASLRELADMSEQCVSLGYLPEIDKDIMRIKIRGIYEEYFCKAAHTILPAAQCANGHNSASQPAALKSADTPKKVNEETQLPAYNAEETPEQQKAAEPVKQAQVIEGKQEPAPEPKENLQAAQHNEENEQQQADETINEKAAAPIAEPKQHEIEDKGPQKLAEPDITAVPKESSPASAANPIKPAAIEASAIVAQNMQGNVLGQKLQQKKISDIAKAIALNDKFQYIRELFNGNAAEFSKTVQALNEMPSFEKAMEHISSSYEWDMESAVTIQFLELVNRRYL
jgi:hypothetical protein